MSADLLIEHCTLRITRHGGWSWGANTRALLRVAMQQLPDMLATRLAASWPAGQDGEIAAPLRLRVPVRMAELLELAACSESDDAPAGLPLLERLDALLLDVVGRELATARPGAPPAPQIAASVPAPDVNVLWAGTVLTVLLNWQRQLLLHEQLLMFSEAALSSWHASLARSSPAPAREVPAQAIARLVAEHAALPLPLPAGRRAALVRALGLMVAAAAQLGLATNDARLRTAMDGERAFDVAADAGIAPGAAPPAAAAIAAPASQVLAARPVLTRFDVKIASALPFLMLGPLSRTGYLQTVGAVFEAAQMLPALPAFAVALARKVLEPPQRGWFRSAPAVSAAAAFAGLPEALPDEHVARMAQQLATLVSPLDSLVAGVLTAGHSAGSALMLHAAPPGWVLFEEEGMFPLACAGRIEQLFARMATLGGELLLVPASALTGGLLARLDDAGFRFVTDASPARGESWRGLPAGPLRAWTNDASSAPPLLSAAALRLPQSAAAGAQLWQALSAERPSAPGLDTTLALAAALALGTIGWSLWREREVVTPMLALDRFADLDARVSFRPELVTVHLPLGRRFMDLKRAGWLDDVADVPWLDGRAVRFVQG